MEVVVFAVPVMYFVKEYSIWEDIHKSMSQS